MDVRPGLLAACLALGFAPAAHGADPITCPAKVGTLELANPNGTFPGTAGDLRGEPLARATYVCNYGERRNAQAYITGQTYILSVSWAGSRASAADIASAKGCGVTLGYNPSLEVASASRRAWADFNIAIEPHTAALRAASQALLAQAEALALGCGATSSPTGPTTTTTTTTAPTTPASPARRKLRWRVHGLHVEKDFFVIAHGRGMAHPADDGAMAAEGDARGTFVLSFYRGIPRVRKDWLGTNGAARPLMGRIWLSVHGPGTHETSHGGRTASLRLVAEVDNVRGSKRMRSLCRAEPFGLLTIFAGTHERNDHIGAAYVQICGLEQFDSVSGDDRFLPRRSVMITDA